MSDQNENPGGGQPDIAPGSTESAPMSSDTVPGSSSDMTQTQPVYGIDEIIAGSDQSAAAAPAVGGQAAYEQYQRDQAAYEQYQRDQAAYEQYQRDAAAYEQYQRDAAAYEQYQRDAAAYEQYQSDQGQLPPVVVAGVVAGAGYASAATEAGPVPGPVSQPAPDQVAYGGLTPVGPPPVGPVPPARPKASSGSGAVRKGVIAGIIAGVIAGLLAGLGGALIVRGLGGTYVSSTTTQYNPTNPKELSPRADNSIAGVAQKTLPTVVSITVKSGQGGDTGSGFVLRGDGYILTNNHVVSAAVGGAGSVTISFSDESTADAKIVGRSVPYDLAVLKVDRSGLPTAVLGNSDSVVVGDAAVAIGSPLGLEGTVTSGIISSVHRPVTAGGEGEASYISALQTDAAINPGNSGGPLVNAEAQVIGVNSAIATLSSSGTSQSGSIGLGFAIPINNAKRIADEIIATGKSSVPIIGVTVNMRYAGPGSEITSVTAGGPAEKAGLASGDVITEINGDPISGPMELLSTIRSYQPGENITLTVKSKSGGTKDVKLALGSQTQ
ncbi:MAG: trypsin-like peptidase domain-containing protein [Actinomycetes bacterium]